MITYVNQSTRYCEPDAHPVTLGISRSMTMGEESDSLVLGLMYEYFYHQVEVLA